eukprot:CAMPEP_0172540656 /NCGR_PEP_ID=MMETSP1067-20121228/11622_1 /TAXON_ID=265564 ORGANISM="Thalassiosira punctigera, Strain Tpunct2005C2" /NCGR_SAMPLE_ID=MMETSP1067 /ASSEMBLY_ACC=CAM_ASM_000444 /LENGTH=279 /DNA_ID=CAMNT_0013326559 /DNA_START=62 /DNA_END=901 /DNA_ORIENTATION=+
MASLTATDLHDLRDDIDCDPASTEKEQDFNNCTLSTMLKKEEYYMCHDYLKGNGNLKNAVECRSRTHQWMLRTVGHMKLQKETVIVGMGLFDRFLCSDSPRAKNVRHGDHVEYQLVAMTCLYIAIKITEPIETDAAVIIRLAKRLQSAESLIRCEMDILTHLRWNLHGPTPFQFIGHILEILPECSTRSEVSRKMRGHALQHAQLAIGDYACVILRRSTIAIASVLNSLETVSRDELPSDERNRFLQKIANMFVIGVTSPLIEVVRQRLLARASNINRV